MANAIILHRRRSEKIEPGNQKFTSSGIFVAPYTALYTVAINGSTHACGKGGNGGEGETGVHNIASSSFQICSVGGGGGGGGGVSQPPTKCAGTIQLTKGQSISITVTEDLVAFGAFASITTGSAPEDGGNGADAYSGRAYVTDASPGAGGQPGADGGDHTLAYSGWDTFEILPNAGSGLNLPATEGETGSLQMGSVLEASGGSGGRGGTSSDGRHGGNGGDGGKGVLYNSGDIHPGESGADGSPAIIGDITISWGGNT